MERVTEMGREVSDDGGVSWSLVDPSPLWEALRVGVRQEDGSVLVDRGDGTGTSTTFDEHGDVLTTEALSDLPIPVPPEPTAEERIAQLEATIDDLLNALGGGA